MQGISFFDSSSFSLSVPAVVGKRNPVTLRMEWKIDETKKVPIRLFAQGYKYKVLGLFETDLHLDRPVRIPSQKIVCILLGTDRMGRDQWSRMMFGTRTSMTVGLVAVALSVILGVLLGGISGYFGGWIDLIIQRLIELLQSLADHSDLAGDDGRAAAGLASRPSLFRDHDHPGVHRLDDAGARGARSLPLSARRRFRARGGSGRVQPVCASSRGTWCRRS